MAAIALKGFSIALQIAALCVVPAVRAAVPEGGTPGWSVYIDNDALSPTQNDRDYTGGIAVTLSGADARDFFLAPDPVLGFADRLLGLHADEDGRERARLHALQVGMIAFTPNWTGGSGLEPGERPYASLLYLASGRTYVGDGDGPVYQTSLSIGALGLDLVADVQTELHEALGVRKPRGWGHQIASDGEPTARYTVSRASLLAGGRTDAGETTRYELKGSVGGSVGYLTDANAALSVRWGRINTPWWGFPPDRVSYIAEPVPLVGAESADAPRELYVWAGAKLSARLYNAFLQGQFRDSDLDYGFDDLRPLVGEAWIGVTGEVARGYRLSWVVRYLTSELEGGRADREVCWGTLFLSHAF
jgi:hypothetical protein